VGYTTESDAESAGAYGSGGAGDGPLAGLKVIDLSTVVAGPLAATLLADYGADVLKVELPDGRDGLRHLPPFKDGVPLWWKVGNRNKRAITLDVRQPDGRELFLRLLSDAVVLVENFRPGTLDRWGLSSGVLFGIQPKLTVLRVTGFGQTGPYRDRPGFARIFDAMSGFTYLNGTEETGPLNLGYPVSDAVAGLFGALAVVSAVLQVVRNPSALGQEIDLSATEAMFRLLDFSAIEYDQLGTVRGRMGNRSSYSAPSNIYKTRDDRWLSLAISTQSVFERFAAAIGCGWMLDDERFKDNVSRTRNVDELDALVAERIASEDLADVYVRLTDSGVTCSPVNSIADVFADPHFNDRGMVVNVDDARLGSVRMQCVVPRFSRTPGSVRRTGPELGADNMDIFRELGLSEERVAELKANRVI